MAHVSPEPGSLARLTEAMRHLAGGVAVITVGKPPERSGYTGTAVFSLSINPERIVISIGRQSSSYSVIRQHGLFGVNILSAGQQHVADLFAGRGGVKGEARYQGAEWIVTPRGVSLLVGALATAEFRVEEIIERHSHAIVIGEPLAISATSDSDALIYWRSAYRAVGSGVRLAAE
ncbi:flavin reductase (DIM6/NTAB) family NADH-FMN oxidoreductase RutF [Roseiarcus fermentans]|uniref:Flavin reductase (DIM6/NTAB) family NADH-FMN oxidoreductase RutF n=2 Tax=Roseiarcus fermentans TaxID=1473586 RepID=A0A366FTX7_9HYPH|nr:flavin reductase (DIM6/NTAB) family NADH-FMN oxidoreductase RutF [Roseiarcus fermentans]